MKNKDITNAEDIARSSRRDFLKKSVVGAGTVAMAGVGLGALTSCGGPEITDKALPSKWDGEYDVIVVGSGFAGLSAAIEAKRTGSSVLLLEKMSTFGGNSAINGGYLAVPNSDLQKKEGVKDSVDLYVQDMLKAGHGLNHVDLARTIAKEVKAAYEFTVECGAEYKPKLSHLGGHSVPRTYYTKNSSGSGIIKPLLATAKKEGVVLKKKSKLETLYAANTGRVVGVAARMNYQFKKEDSGKVRKFKANKAVIIASGGFSQDQAYRSAQDPRLTGNVDSTNQPGATAEALAEIFRVGGVPVHVSRIQLGPWACPDEKGFGVGSPFNIDAGLRFGIMVGRKTGKRFVNELADRKTRADAMLMNVDSKGKPDYPIILTDSEGASQASTLERALEAKVVRKFNSLQELAKYHKIPYGELKKTVDNYNAAVKNKVDKEPEFGKPIPKNQKPIAKAPFYALRGWPKVHHTMGGAKVNTEAQVLEMGTEKPIAGLYAAGEVVGGPHGASRLGSCAIADCLVFGRIAGKNAGKEKPWS